MFGSITWICLLLIAYQFFNWSDFFKCRFNSLNKCPFILLLNVFSTLILGLFTSGIVVISFKSCQWDRYYLVFNAFPNIRLLTHSKSIIGIIALMNSPEPCTKCRSQLTLPGGGSRLILSIRSDKCYLAKRETVLSSQDLTVRSWAWWPHTFLPALWPYGGQHQVGSLPPASLVSSRLQSWWVIARFPLCQWLPHSGTFSFEPVSGDWCPKEVQNRNAGANVTV